jgi:hypothetical protein
MTRVQRLRYADPERVESHPVDSAQTIDLGELCWLNTNDARPADQFTYVTGNLAGTQANFAAMFIGVAMDTSESGDTAKIAIATEGVFEFVCAAAQFEIGDLVGVDDNTGGTALLPAQVIAVGENGAASAIGRVVRQYTANTTRVLVELLPRKLVTPIFIPLGTQLITSAVDLVTDWAVTFPFKLNRLHSVVTVLTAGAGVISVHNGATALDDTMTIADASAVGTVDVAVMDDATGDDIFIVGDTVSILSDGTPTAGEAFFMLEVTPFLREA